VRLGPAGILILAALGFMLLLGVAVATAAAWVMVRLSRRNPPPGPPSPPLGEGGAGAPR
jgi:hypothetical protein